MLRYLLVLVLCASYWTCVKAAHQFPLGDGLGLTSGDFLLLAAWMLGCLAGSVITRIVRQ